MARSIADLRASARMENLRDLVFGYDLFISHDSDEAGAYAQQLKQLAEASKPPIRCFLDRCDFSVGDELNAGVVRRLRMSRHCVVIVTPGVGAPGSWVPTELKEFTHDGKRNMDRIAPLNVGESLQGLPPDAAVRRYIPFAPDGKPSLLYHSISTQEFAEGPSEITLKQLEGFLGARRIDRRRLRVFQAATAVLLVLAAAAVVSATMANLLRRDAERARSRAMEALRTQSRMLIDASQRTAENGDCQSAALLALEGLPDATSRDVVRRDWPYVPELERQLFRHALAIRERSLLVVPVLKAGALRSNGGSRLLIGGHLHDAHSGRLIAALLDTGHEVPTIFFARQGEWVVFVKEGRAHIVRSDDGGEVAGALQHPDGVTLIAVAPDASLAVTGHEDGTVRLQRVGGPAVALAGHLEASGQPLHWNSSLTFDPGSKHFVLTTGGRDAELWWVEGPSRVAVLHEPTEIRGAAFDPTGSSFLLLPEVSDDSEAPILLYDTSTGKLRGTLSGNRGTVWDASFSRDGARLLTGSADNKARLWDVMTGKLLHTFVGHGTDVVAAEFVGKDGDKVLTQGQATSGAEQDDETIRLWRMDGTSLRSLTLGSAWVSVVDVHPSRATAAVSYADVGTVVWNLDTGVRSMTLRAHQSYIRGTAYVAGGARLATVADDSTLRFWDVGPADPWKARLVHPDHDAIVNDLVVREPTTVTEAAFGTSANSLITLAGNGRGRWLSVWDLRTNPPTLRHGAFLDPATVGLSLRTGLGVWETAAGLELRDLHDGRVRDVMPDVSPPIASLAWAGQAWAAAAADGIIVIRDWARRAELARLRHPVPPPLEMAMDAAGHRLVTAGSDGVVRWWRVGASAPAAQSTSTSPGPASVVSDGDRLVVVAGAAGGMEVFDLEGRRLCRFQPARPANRRDPRDRPALVVSLSSPARTVAAATGPVIELRDAATGELRRTLTGHEEKVTMTRDFAAVEYTSSGAVTDLAFTRDGTRLISAANDGTAKVWDVATGEVVATLEGHGAALRPPMLNNLTRTDIPEVFFYRAVTSATLSPDERQLVTTSADGTARIWPFFRTTQALVDHVKDQAVRCLTPDQRRTYRLDTEPPEWCAERGRWPFDNQAWKLWLKAKRAGASISMPQSTASHE